MSSYQIEQLTNAYAEVEYRKVQAKTATGSGKTPFFAQIDRRTAKKKDTRIIIEGEGGDGKSYAALRMGEVLDKRFTEDPEGAVAEQVLFSAEDFLTAVRTMPVFSVLIYDEPAQSFHHREFMTEANIILSKTMIGYRYKRFVSILNIPDLGLIDKDAKTLINFLINMTDQGHGEIFRKLRQKFGGDPWFATIEDSHFFRMPGVKLRHFYEKKKEPVQDALHEQWGKALAAKNAPRMTNLDIALAIQNDGQRTKGRKDREYNISAIMGDFDVGRERARAILRKIVGNPQESGK